MGFSTCRVRCICLCSLVHAQEVLKALAQNRIGKDNAAVEFSKTDIIQRTWPRLRSIATLWILALTIPISVWGGLLLVLAHLLKGGRLVGCSPNPSNKTRKGYHPTAIVTGVPLQYIFTVQHGYCQCKSHWWSAALASQNIINMHKLHLPVNNDLCVCCRVLCLKHALQMAGFSCLLCTCLCFTL